MQGRPQIKIILGRKSLEIAQLSGMGFYPRQFPPSLVGAMPHGAPLPVVFVGV